MKGPHHIAVGIDIEPHQVHMVVLKRSKKKITLKAVAQCPLPEEIIQNGHVEELETLVKILGKLKSQCKLPPHAPVGLSVTGLPMVLQVVKLPKQLPGNVSQFINQEIKQCVAFAGRDVLTDYGSVGGAQRTVTQVLGVGGDEASIRQFVEACQQAHLNVDWVEPPLLGLVRTLYEKRITSAVDRNLMLVVQRGRLMHLAVFRGGSLDFVRERQWGDESQTDAQLSVCLIQDIDALIQFYAIEVDPNGSPWDIMMSLDQDPSIQKKIDAGLAKSLPDVRVQVLDEPIIRPLLTVDIDDRFSLSEISWTAFGTALRGVREADQALRINLLPPDIAKVTVIKRQGLRTAAAAFFVLVVMAMVAYGMGLRAAQIQDKIQNANRLQNREETIKMVTERRKLEHKIKQLKQANKQLEEIKATRDQADWSALLDDIRTRVPESLWLDRVETQNQDHVLLITGGSLTWRAVTLFAGDLSKSPHIADAKVVRNDQRDDAGRVYIKYQIRCQLEGKVKR